MFMHTGRSSYGTARVCGEPQHQLSSNILAEKDQLASAGSDGRALAFSAVHMFNEHSRSTATNASPFDQQLRVGKVHLKQWVGLGQLQ